VSSQFSSGDSESSGVFPQIADGQSGLFDDVLKCPIEPLLDLLRAAVLGFWVMRVNEHSVFGVGFCAGHSVAMLEGR
jgi:hypothetical protein